MKPIILFLSFVLSDVNCLAQAQSIIFEKDSFAVVKEKALKENKLIFIDAYTEWCGPCKWLAKNVFTNDTVAEFFNGNFINMQIDMEKGEGPALAEYYKVYCYPNLLFVDGNGKLIHRAAGAMKVPQFMIFAQNALNPEKQFVNYSAQYETKKNDTKFLYDYIYMLSGTCLPVKEAVADYFNIVKEENLTGRQSWNIIRDFIKDRKSSQFGYLLKNSAKFAEKYTADSVNTAIKNVFLTSGFNILYSKDYKEEKFKKYLEEIKAEKFQIKDEVLYFLNSGFYEKNKDWKNFGALFLANGEKYYRNENEFNNIAWSIYENCTDVKVLKKASEIMKKILDKDNGKTWYVWDTYAALLYKLKNKNEAKAAALKAVEYAKEGGVSESEYETTMELLEKIEKLN